MPLLSRIGPEDIRTFFKIAEKQGNDENEHVQENVPIDIIRIYGKYKMGKTNKKNFFSQTLIFATWLLWKHLFLQIQVKFATINVCKN